ncbi:type II CRISPR-associated endonuclease Cas1 [Dermabacter hominis]|uniref:type II CRISPR-associated endonuclease Cas1 n=1 Tax=Dermabacter hominis TaxID=36740 RepID=UPI0007740D8F|nr:type II CRISPR-associated endonuclease Cas1 [Dermabacter hominis]
MSSKWRVLDLLEFKGFVGYERGALLVGDTPVPLDAVATVLLGQKASWGYGLVAAAERFDVQVIVCDWRNLPVGILQHFSHASRVGARQRAQAALKQRTKDAAWRRIVRAKVLGQSAMLSEVGNIHDSRHLKELSTLVQPGDSTNIEGAAAMYYWSRVLPGFSRRQESSDFANAALNYGYTILRGCVLSSICAAGLLPGLGIHHGSAVNPFPLADDLIEPFRPAVDSAVVGLVKTGVDALNRDSKKTLAGVLELQSGGNGSRLRTQITDLCQAYGKFVERESSSLRVPVWSGS